MKPISLAAFTALHQTPRPKPMFRRALFGCVPLVEHFQSKMPTKLTQSLKNAAAIWTGGAAQPMKTKIQAGSVYVSYPMDSATQSVIQKQLPPNIMLCKMQTTTDQQAQYQLTLNAYDIEGSVVKGCRMELSTYVIDTSAPSQKPFYMILKAWSDTPSYDPVEGMTKACDLSLKKSNLCVEGSDTSTTWLDNTRLNITLKTPQQETELKLEFKLEQNTHHASHDWAQANERCYWRTGDYDEIRDPTLFLSAPYQALTLTKATGRLDFIEEIQTPTQAIATTSDLNVVIEPKLK